MTVLDTIRNAFARTSDLSTERQEFLRGCADLGDTRLNGYTLYANYYDGKMELTLSERQRAYLRANGVPFNENFTETVVDAMARRRRVEGFQVEGDDPATDWLKAGWARQDRLQGVIHAQEAKLGDAFVIVDFDSERGRPRLRYNHPRLIKPVYDSDGDGDDLLYTVKKWTTSRRSVSNPNGALVYRLNIFHPDRVEKWFSVDKEGQDWAPHRDTAEDAWPTPWTISGELPADGEADDPLGIPVFHFRNKAQGGWYGRSEIRGAIPFQHELDKQLLDLFDVMDFQAWSQRWGSGIGDSDTLGVAIGEILTSQNENARFGEFAATNPGPLLDAIDSTLRRLSAKTGTPLHDLIKGTPPSGEALKTAESSLVAKVHDANRDDGSTWEGTVAMAWQLADLHDVEGVPVFDPTADVTAFWDSVETRDQKSEAETFAVYVRELGLSKRTALRELGYDPESEAEARAEEAQVGADALASAFNAGVGGGNI